MLKTDEGLYRLAVAGHSLWNRMTPSETLLYLSRDAVEAAGLGPGEMIGAVERAFAAQAAGQVRIGAKVPLPIATGHFFQTMLGALDAPGLAGMKWFGVVPDNPARGLPNVCALVVLSDIATGLPLAVMDGVSITGMRTAAMSAVAAKHLAGPDSKTAAFIGCGLQARSHADYLRHVLPGLRRAALFGRGAASRDSLAARLRERDWEVRLAADPNDALNGADIVVSTVPEYAGMQPFLDARQLAPGAFVAAVDLGRSWLPPGYAAFDRVATDDIVQARHLLAEGKLKSPPGFDADLAGLASGRHDGRRSGGERVFFVFAGHVLGDLAAAAALYERATARGLGIRLPR